MPDPTDGVLGTIGLEIETELVPEHFQIPGWMGTHDASIESPALSLRNAHGYIIMTPENMPVIGMMMGDRITLGTEYVSEIIFTDEDAENKIKTLISMIQRFGERPQNTRAGIHVHVGWAYDLRSLKRTIQINNWLESMLFHLGGMGYEFRGMINNSAYCRPLTKFGPPVVDSNIGTVQMTNVDALLSANSIENFWNRYGGIRFFSPPKRYTPQRYMGVNLFSIFLHKTLEFRMFNTTLNSDYIIAVMKLCKEIARFTLSCERIPDVMNSVYDVSERAVNHNVLSELLGFIELDSNTENVLREIIERSPVPKLNPVYVASHIRDRQIEFQFRDVQTVASMYPHIMQYENPGIVDVHMLEDQLGGMDLPRRLRPPRRQGELRFGVAGNNGWQVVVDEGGHVHHDPNPNFEVGINPDNPDQDFDNWLDQDPDDDDDEQHIRRLEIEAQEDEERREREAQEQHDRDRQERADVLRQELERIQADARARQHNDGDQGGPV